MNKSIEYKCFKGKKVIIIGGSGGIGLVTAMAFADNGSNVTIISKTRKKLDNVQLIAKDHGLKDRVTVFQLDITNTNAFSQWFDEGHECDILINCVGVYPARPLLDVSENEWDLVFTINLKAVFFASRTVAKSMKKEGKGVIVNVSSFASKMPSINMGVYAASKSALSSLSKSMAAEWAPYNIRVNAVNPGVIDTDMTRALLKEKSELLESQIALKRIGRPEEVAAAVLFLASDSSSYITGDILDVTGGKFIVQDPLSAWLI